MNAAEMKLKDIEKALFSGVPSEDFVAACEADVRAGVQRLAKRYRREQAERARLDALYAYEYAARDVLAAERYAAFREKELSS